MTEGFEEVCGDVGVELFCSSAVAGTVTDQVLT